MLDSKREPDQAVDRRSADDRRLPRRRIGSPLRHGAGRPARRSTSRSPSSRSCVRGLDYYRRTIFEFQGGTLDSAQNALGGGGRYDGLVEALGGPATPGVGFALGLDRTLLACDDEGVFGADERPLDAFVVDVVGGGEATVLTADAPLCGARPPTAATTTAR